MEALSQSAFLERVQQATDVMKQHEDLNIFIHADYSQILSDAESYARSINGEHGQLHGELIALKDNINVRGLSTSCASHILDGYLAPYDATVTTRIREAGGFILAKTNMDQFAMGSSTEYSYFGPTKNPVDPTKVPGGSSGGSAAAVQTGAVDMALGSETGGSVRQPAAFCGVVGLKPTYGRVSRYGLVAFASSFDQVSPFGRTVKDVARLTEVIAGHDPNDSTSVDIEVPKYLDKPVDSVSGWRIGLPKQYFTEGLNQEIADRIHAVADWLKSEGAELIDIDIPHAEYSVATYYVLTTAEASSNLARFDGMRYGLRETRDNLEDTYTATRHEGFGPEVKRRIMLGTYVLSAGYYEAYYGKAQKVRRLIKRDYDSAFEDVDVLLSPTTPTTAFELGAKTDDPLEMYLSDIYTVSANLSGIPAMSIPVGTDGQNLPIGMQIMAKPFAEETIFQLGHYIERHWNS